MFAISGLLASLSLPLRQISPLAVDSTPRRARSIKIDGRFVDGRSANQLSPQLPLRCCSFFFSFFELCPTILVAAQLQVNLDHALFVDAFSPLLVLLRSSTSSSDRSLITGRLKIRVLTLQSIAVILILHVMGFLTNQWLSYHLTTAICASWKRDISINWYPVCLPRKCLYLRSRQGIVRGFFHRTRRSGFLNFFHNSAVRKIKFLNQRSDFFFTNFCFLCGKIP